MKIDWSVLRAPEFCEGALSATSGPARSNGIRRLVCDLTEGAPRCRAPGIPVLSAGNCEEQPRR